jgi:hypothetical protein
VASHDLTLLVLSSKYAIETSSVASDLDKELDISGERMVISNRLTNERLAQLTYYWVGQYTKQFCPSMPGDVFRDELRPTEIAMYVLGLGPVEQRLKLKEKLRQ